MSIWGLLNHLIKQSWFIWTLFIVNLLGTVYGYYWYREQLADTPIHLLPFVPDSPTASLFFTLVLLLLLLGKRAGLIAAFAAVTSIKYGIWAIVAILWGFSLGDPMRPDLVMLVISHGGMAFEAVLFYKVYRIRLHHLIIVSAWTLLNDFLDYTLDIHPWVADVVEVYHNALGWTTLGLSIFSIILVGYLAHRNRTLFKSEKLY